LGGEGKYKVELELLKGKNIKNLVDIHNYTLTLTRNPAFYGTYIQVSEVTVAVIIRI